MIKAIEIQKNIRKRQCCILFVVLLVIGLVVLFMSMKSL
eukprot:GSChrysophyteH1.ASY1.ANO1.763.1 assembled CDS